MKKHLHILILVTLSLLIFALQRSVAQESKYNESLSVYQEKYPNSAVVILLDEGKIELKKDGKAKGKFHLKLKILNERGLYKRDLQLYGRETKKIKKFKGTVIKPDGDERKVKDADELDTSYSSKNRVYQDIELKSIFFREVSVGCILDYKYEVDYESFIDLPSWTFDGIYPVEKTELSLQFPADIKLFRTTLDTSNLIKLNKSKIKNDSLLVWTASNLPPIEIEPRMPSLSLLKRRIFFWMPSIRFQNKMVSFGSWEAIVNWYCGLFKDKFNIDRSILESRIPLLKGKPDLLKAEIIFQYVRDQFRYIDIDLNDGHYEPNDAKTILRRHYGDSKDISLVTTALLRAVSLQAYPALLKSRNYGRILDGVYTLRQFDRMITAVFIGRDTLYLDPTYLVCPFKLLPPYAQDSDVLILKEGNSIITKTPSFDESHSTFRQWYKIEFVKNGDITVNGNIHATGLAGDLFKALDKVATHREKERFFESVINANVPGVKITANPIIGISNPIDEVDSDRTYVNGKFTFECARFYNYGDEFIFISPNILNKTGLPSFATYSEKERIHPVVFENRFAEYDTVEIRIPEGYRIYETPNNEQIMTRDSSAVFITYYKPTKDSVSVIFYRQFELKKYWFNAGPKHRKEYADLRQFYRKVTLADQREIILQKVH